MTRSPRTPTSPLARGRAGARRRRRHPARSCAALFGRHVFVPRHGAAVHVNAFNFPAWGMAEERRRAPRRHCRSSASRPRAPRSAAWRFAKIMVDAGVLPEGAFQFIAGSTGDLLDHVTGQDVLAFTGSSNTGATLRTSKGVVAASVRVNVEADSLNAAVMGPDVEDGSDLMGLFLGDVVRDLQQKTGQKCTAIRRVYVPRERLASVVEQLKDRLSAIKVGDPSREEVTMGPVATAQQQRDVSALLATFAKHGRFVMGGGERGTVLGVPEGKGFFVAPSLLVCESPAPGDAIHTHEIFGPSVTVMPYDGTPANAAALVAAGGGGLVSSVYSDDKAFVQGCVLAIAPFHGRVTIGSSKIVGQAIPPGTVMAQLVHGGPGRAGAGEELGGRRGLAFYLQRAALQGDRALLDAITGKRD
ncbi:MAG: aldehyde dehydrogenase family protein [Polyangiaceae bacterium]